MQCSEMLAKVLWLPPITAHCFRPQWATPDQLVLQCHPMHWAVQCINNLVCSVQGKCIGMCLVLTAVRLGAVCAGALVAVSDDQRGFNWSMTGFVTEPRLHASQQPFHWKRLRIQEKVKICDVDPVKGKQTMNKVRKENSTFQFRYICVHFNPNQECSQSPGQYRDDSQYCLKKTQQHRMVKLI